ncbi:hypothetical protein CLAFUW4_07533 [Fulvia fulva]|uniref:Mg2+ transporter protein, CorA-like/Zinc transport protein ZntB n=1 Tax=Passalora fulva TaxID=5499 RepID=A0A9Q8PBK6_PASFU|nr:uncharacterized protein CLAFUR5_07663 [Fulvia fulva]KAK4621351.1 hypothetical protein CLAFUR4_07539 [Fulvia fulva]KAK4623041.1 hypothetical protein CLAFUR0_07538 [Fulvia fulva]UJO19475.1 hypothetical protein CLAFUR5_07663 [Fulvia fulva]WPV16038.1 hypothetical protein CLAFUW4_07533 [Fulvia fulva]WPV31652.1 hypothetical protein CLAFUW7_07535 [Fulvia fulva]
MSKEDLELVRAHPKLVGMQAYRLTLHDWLVTLKFMQTQLAKVEWEFEMPGHGQNPVDHWAALKKLAPWERHAEFREDMVNDMRIILDLEPNTHGSVTLLALKQDVVEIRKSIVAIRHRLALIRDMITTNVGIEESRRTAAALEQNRSIGGLTILATIFLPLNFATSFLSMSSGFSVKSNTFWRFFAIGVPLLTLTLLAVGLMSWGLKTLAFISRRLSRAGVRVRGVVSDVCWAVCWPARDVFDTVVKR